MSNSDNKKGLVVEKKTKQALKTAGGSALGAALGAGVLGAFPKLNPLKALVTGFPEPALRLAVPGLGALIGGTAGATLASDSAPNALGADLGSQTGSVLGALAAFGAIKANPKQKLLKHLLGIGTGGAIGAGAGSYLANTFQDSDAYNSIKKAYEGE